MHNEILNKIWKSYNKEQMEIKIKNDWQLKQVRSTSTHRSNIEIVTL